MRKKENEETKAETEDSSEEEEINEEKIAHDNLEDTIIKNERKMGQFSFKLFLMVGNEMGGIRRLIVLLFISMLEASLFQYSSIYGASWAENFEKRESSKYSAMLIYCLLYAFGKLVC